MRIVYFLLLLLFSLTSISIKGPIKDTDKDPILIDYTEAMKLYRDDKKIDAYEKLSIIVDKCEKIHRYDRTYISSLFITQEIHKENNQTNLIMEPTRKIIKHIEDVNFDNASIKAQILVECGKNYFKFENNYRESGRIFATAEELYIQHYDWLVSRDDSNKELINSTLEVIIETAWLSWRCNFFSDEVTKSREDLNRFLSFEEKYKLKDLKLYSRYLEHLIFMMLFEELDTKLETKLNELIAYFKNRDESYDEIYHQSTLGLINLYDSHMCEYEKAIKVSKEYLKVLDQRLSTNDITNEKRVILIDTYKIDIYSVYAMCHAKLGDFEKSLDIYRYVSGSLTMYTANGGEQFVEKYIVYFRNLITVQIAAGEYQKAADTISELSDSYDLSHRDHAADKYLLKFDDIEIKIAQKDYESATKEIKTLIRLFNTIWNAKTLRTIEGDKRLLLKLMVYADWVGDKEFINKILPIYKELKSQKPLPKPWTTFYADMVDREIDAFMKAGQQKMLNQHWNSAKYFYNNVTFKMIIIPECFDQTKFDIAKTNLLKAIREQGHKELSQSYRNVFNLLK